MTSEKQKLANQQNAKLAGVKTEAGKNKVRYNSLKHGLTAKCLVVNTSAKYEEKIGSFEELVDGLTQTFKPRNFHEELLLDQMAKALFKLRRCEHLEAACFESVSSGVFTLLSEESDKRFCIYMTNQFELVQKYRSSLEGQYYRALHTLKDGRAAHQLDLFAQFEPSGVENGTD